MARITVELREDLAREVDRLVRDGWFRDADAVVREAVGQFVGTKTYLGDSPRMLQRFAADALNESKPETALKFVDRALTLLAAQKLGDLSLYQQMIELRVQILLVMDRNRDALLALEEAKERLPNSPAILRWIGRVQRMAEREAGADEPAS